MQPYHRSPGWVPKADVSVKSINATVKQLPVFSLECTYQIFPPFSQDCFHKALLSIASLFTSQLQKWEDFFPKMKEEFSVVFNTYLFTLGKQETHTHSKVRVARQSKYNLNRWGISVADSAILHCHVRSDSSHIKVHLSSLNIFPGIFSENSSNKTTHRRRMLERKFIKLRSTKYLLYLLNICYFLAEQNKDKEKIHCKH